MLKYSTKQNETQMIIWRFNWPCLTDDSLATDLEERL